MDRKIYRQTDIWTEKHIHRHIDRQTGRDTDWQPDELTDLQKGERQIDRQPDHWQKDRQSDIHIFRQMYRLTERQTYIGGHKTARGSDMMDRQI